MTFKELKITDKDKIYPFFENNRFNLCVYSPKSILAWRDENYFPVFNIQNNSLYIGARFLINEDENHLILPQSTDKEIYHPKNLFKIIKNSGFNFYKYVPQSYIDEFSMQGIEKFFDVKEISADSDYIYKKDDLSELKGRKYSKKRNLVNQFLKEYENRFSFSEIKDEKESDVLDFLDEWCLKRDCEKEPESDIYCEKKAAENAISYSDYLDYKTIVMKIDNEIQAIALSSNLTNNMGALHFQKASFDIKGLYQFFDKNCAKKLFQDNITFINKESDMDDEGLRKAKKSYYPHEIISSYNLIPKPL